MAEGRIIEVIKASKVEKANLLLQAGWELFAVVPKAPADTETGVHWCFVKREKADG